VANLGQVAVLSGRATRQSLRNPQFLAPVLVLPTLFLIAYAGGVAGGANLPGFPAGAGMFEFQLGGDMLLSAMMAGVIGGVTQVVDIQSKFFDRLLLTPTSASAVVFGRLVGVGMLGLLGGVFFTVIGLVFGGRPAGVGGVLMMLLLQVLTAMGFGAVTVAIALRTGQGNAVQIFLPLGIVLTMFSSAFFPRHLLLSPLDTVAAYNPLSYIADGLHAPWIGGLTATVAWRAVVALAVIWLVGGLLCARALKHRAEAG
jgi:ABC-2 type transport system permease protein